jgi:hypothetical protein
MAPPHSTIEARFKQFCEAYDIPKRHHGSLSMLAEMAFVFDMTIEAVLTPIATPDKQKDL